MAFLTQRILQSLLKSPAAVRRAWLWDEPDLVTLPALPGRAPSQMPPVRIYLGTEPAQYKAERIFIWSIMQVRDPSRVYEIYLMKCLKGFRSRFWLTGFTNYRFAIPHFAGATGRAIYNDVDQIYLKDPAELFDLPMADHGYLSVHAGDISVALLDCEKMARLWSLEDARTRGKNELLARAANTPGLWGQLDGGWNARDLEYQAGESGVLHYTALHRQPWHPFPAHFVYQKNAYGYLWYDLEENANKAAFRTFSIDGPSRGFSAMRKRADGQKMDTQEAGGPSPAKAVARYGDLVRLLQGSNAENLLHCRIKAFSGSAALPVSDEVRSIQRVDPLASEANAVFKGRFDAVVCTDTLEFIPDDDVPWLLDQLFRATDRLLYCRVIETRAASGDPALSRSQPWNRTIEWWHYQFQTVARHHPKVRWQLQLERSGSLPIKKAVTLDGNESAQRELKIWVINGRKLGHSSQSTAIAEILQWPYERKLVQQRFRRQIPVLFHLGFGRIGPCEPPWPDIIIACGWWPSHLARWIKARNHGRTRLLLAGRKSGGIKSCTDIVVCCEHFHLPVHRRRIETLLPVHPLTDQRMDEARQRGECLFGNAARPRVAMLVGGDSKQHSFTAGDAALMGQKVLEQVRQLGGSLFAVTARRTSPAAAEALAKVFSDKAHLHVWSAEGKDNPYLEYLAAADILVVSGESESMLTDAIATAKPVYIYPLPQRPLEPMMALGQWLLKRTSQRPKNRRGTERPQQGFEYLCARLLQLEWILPPRDIEALHRSLIESGYAAPFGQRMQTKWDGPAYHQEELANRLRIMLDQPTCEAERSVETVSQPRLRRVLDEVS